MFISINNSLENGLYEQSNAGNTLPAATTFNPAILVVEFGLQRTLKFFADKTSLGETIQMTEHCGANPLVGYTKMDVYNEVDSLRR